MNDYSSLFTSGLMLLCESTNTHSRHTVSEMSLDNTKNTASGLRSFLSLEMADSLRTFATSPASNSSSRAHSRKPSSERRARAGHSPAASPSKPTANAHKAPLSPASSRRRSLPQPKPAPLAELPVVPAAHTHGRSRSDSDASQALPTFAVVPAPKSDSALLNPLIVKEKPVGRKDHLVPSTLKLELSSAPTTPCSPFPTTPRSSHAISMFSPLTPSSADTPSFPMNGSISPDFWSIYAATLSPTTESALGLHHLGAPAAGPENIAPCNPPVVLKRARVRRNRHSAPSRNASVTANSMRSSQMSVSTSYRRTQRSGALAQLEGRIPRSEWMSDDEEGASSKLRGLSLMPSMTFHPESDKLCLPISRLSPYLSEDQNRSFIDLTDDAASLATRRRAS
ncbi:hypothetical protein RHS04_05789 [Rhizoctonia solani]|uniref:Uncharacterized protein n=1 Tax=Rhizoctonia solani TaxID=456999 RepID=A0A8H7H5E0_9AGAM|nr:hypothetical protein RHS04_05789 [Rhizoctonia solani]